MANCELQRQSPQAPPPIRLTAKMLSLAIGLLAGPLSIAAQTHDVPLHFRQVSGTRPFIDVQMNGKPFQLMVHANANFYVMTTHANAASIGLGDLKKSSDFGISAEGHVDSLGRAETTLESLRVGESEASKVPLSVFEVRDLGMQGMLGIGWLKDKRVIVDFDECRLSFPDSADDSRAEAQRLTARGYIAHKMVWDPAKKVYWVNATVEGTPARLQVSTVSHNMLDSRFAHESGISIGPIIDVEAGPRGAVVNSWLAKSHVSIAIDGQLTAPSQPWIFDFYAYNSAARPVGEPGKTSGSLGAEFMLANRAVIDFGTDTLFVRQR